MLEVNIHGYFLTPHLLNRTVEGDNLISKSYILNDGRKDIARIVVYEEYCEVKLFHGSELERRTFTSTNARNYVPQVHGTKCYDFVEYIKEVIDDYVNYIVKQF